MNKTFLYRISVLVASCFYLSLLPEYLARRIAFISKDALLRKRWTGGGFVGSILGVVTYVFLPFKLANSWFMVLGCLLLAILAAHYAEEYLKNKDDSRIIIDEWIGAWVACVGLVQVLHWQLICAFLFFRIFDVWKGPWMQILQRLPGGLGVVADDLLAGCLARALVMAISLFVSMSGF